MSFCRFSEGDVYLVPTEEGIVCYGCALYESEPNVFTSIDGAVEHLLKHCVAGHKAPYTDVIERLRNTTMEMVNGKVVYRRVD
jgi:hypothetical protein